MRRPPLAPIVLFLLALAVRLPHFATIPAPTDETDELLLALSIVRHGALPLTANEPYLGPLPVYLTAAAFSLLGPSFAAGRLVALLLGALIAPATWALGRSLAGKRAGLAAGCLSVAAFGPVLVGSHIAWGHGLAPSLVALALAGLVAALRAPTRWRWLATGVAAGLAVGAHPTVLALAPGAAVWWVAQRRAGKGGPATGLAWLTLGAFAGYLPNLAFVATRGLGPFRERAAEHDYVASGLSGWLPGVMAWLGSWARNLSGPATADATSMVNWLALLLLTTGLLWAARRTSWLPLAVVASGTLLMPLMVAGEKYVSFTGLRYAQAALPLGLVAAGMWLVALDGGPGRRWRQWTLVAVVVALQLAMLAGFYRALPSTGVTGAPVLAVADGLAAAHAAGHDVFVDDALDTKLVGGGEVGRAVRTMLTLRGIEHTVAKVDKMRWFLINGQGATYDLVLAGDTADALGREFALESLAVTAVVPGQVSRSGDHWGWYRYRPQVSGAGCRSCSGHRDRVNSPHHRLLPARRHAGGAAQRSRPALSAGGDRARIAPADRAR